MVFDFFRKRAEEGVEQLSNLATSASEGRLSEGLMDAASYTTQTNEAFALGLAKSRNKLLYNLEGLLNNEGEDFLDNLEDMLLQADIGIQTSEDVMEEVRSLREASVDFLNRDSLKSVLRGKLLEALDMGGPRAMNFATTAETVEEEEGKKELTVWMVMGANGMGKTTTIGKLANRLRTEGNQKVMVAACDTFRAAAVDQLQAWADRAEVECFKPIMEGDSGSGTTKATAPSSVLYAALDKALKEEFDVLIVDTSGRLSNNDPLTAELVKMKNVIQKRMSVEKDPETDKPIFNRNVPHEILLVVDAAQGRMAVDSAKAWDKALDLTGLILTKLDGSAKGGSVVAVSRELKLPVKLIGVGEGINDLRDFDAEPFVDSLLGIGTAGGNDSSSNEGKLLASRLDDMRKERALRSKELSAKISTSSKTDTTPSIDFGAGTNNDKVATASTSNSRGGGKNKNKKKNKKKKGRR